jgi:hypothetical protein
LVLGAVRPQGTIDARFSCPEVRMAERRRRKAVVLGVPALIVAGLTLAALWRVSTPPGSEPGAAGTIGLNPDRVATLERVQVRELTSDRTLWVGGADDDPIFVVSDRPVRFEPGAEITITGRVEVSPTEAAAVRDWGISEATARDVRARGVYVRASRIVPAR